MQSSCRRLLVTPSPSTSSRLPRSSSSTSIASAAASSVVHHHHHMQPTSPTPSRGGSRTLTSSATSRSPSSMPVGSPDMHMSHHSRAELHTIAESLLAQVRFPNTAHSMLSQSPARSPLFSTAPLPLTTSSGANAKGGHAVASTQPLRPSAARHFEGKEGLNAAGRSSRHLNQQDANCQPHDRDGRGRNKSVKGLASKNQQ